MMRLLLLALPLLVAAGLSACRSREPETPQVPQAASADTAQPGDAPAAATPRVTHPAPVFPAAASQDPTAADNSFDVHAVPVTDRSLPAFPYIATPADLGSKEVFTEKDIEFDRVYVLAGDKLHAVEGKVFHRKFFLHQLKWSPLAAHRNYENALKSLGAVRVDAVHPDNDRFVERNGGDGNAIWKKMRIPGLSQSDDPDAPGFEQWLLRTPSTNVWISFFLANGQLHLLTVEEKAMQQLVEALPADKTANAGKAR